MDETFAVIASRFEEIGKGLDCHTDVVTLLQNVRAGIDSNLGLDWTVSRGEWLSAKILARFLGGRFVDAAKLIQLRDAKS